MDQIDSHCPYLLISLTTAKVIELVESVEKKAAVELNSIPTLLRV